MKHPNPTPEELKEYVERGYYIGVTGFLIRKDKKNPDGGAKLKEALSAGVVPADRLMIETDAPYMGFKHCRKGQAVKPKNDYPNVPSSLPLLLDAVAECLGKPAEEVARETTATAKDFFRIG